MDIRREHRHFALLAVLGLVIAAVFATVVTSGQAAQRSLRAAAQDRLGSVGSLAATTVSNEFGAVGDLVAAWSRTEGAADAVRSSSGRPTPELARLLSELRAASPGIDATLAATPDGTPIAHIGERVDRRGAPDLGVDVRQVRASDVAVIGQLVLPHPGRPLGTAVSAAVRDGDGAVAGIITAIYRVDHLQEVLGTYHRERGVAMTVVDASGFVLASATEPPTAAERTTDRRLLTQLDRTAHLTPGDRYLVSASGRTRGSDSRLWSVAPVPEIGGAVLVEIPEETALAGLSRQRSTTRWALVITSALVLATVVALLDSERRRRRLLAQLRGQNLALQRSADWTAAVLETAPVPLAILDDAGHILSVNSAFTTLLDVAPGTILARPLDSILLPDRRRGSAEGIVRFVGRGGRERLGALHHEPVIDPDGVPAALVTLHDVTDHHEAQELLRRRADTDPLTGAWNRGGLIERFETRLEAKGARALACLFIDLDGFKVINDTYGHSTGDELLLAVTGRLIDEVRDDDLVARFGGDEFVIVAELSDAGALPDLVTRLRSAIEAPIAIGRNLVTVGASVGAAVAGPDGARATDLLAVADARMYDVKHGARAAV